MMGHCSSYSKIYVLSAPCDAKYFTNESLRSPLINQKIYIYQSWAAYHIIVWRCETEISGKFKHKIRIQAKSPCINSGGALILSPNYVNPWSLYDQSYGTKLVLLTSNLHSQKHHLRPYTFFPFFINFQCVVSPQLNYNESVCLPEYLVSMTSLF